jgi:HK97 gp10 family phage protein
MTDSIVVKGLQETNKALYSYSQQLGDKVILSALRNGANLVKKGAQAAAPIKTGALRRGLKVVRSKIYRGKVSSATIGVYLTLSKGGGRRSKKDKKDAFYGRFQEDGWNVRGKTNTVGRENRRGKFRFSRAVQTAYFGGKTGRKSLPGKRDIPGKKFIKGSFERNKTAAVQLIIRSAEAGADVVKRKLGMR